MSVAFEDGVWRLVDGERSTTIHGRDPQREADRVVAGLLDSRDPDLLVVIGLGLGFLLEALERRRWTGRVLAIEPEAATVAAMRVRRDWSAWTSADRLRILCAPAFEGATDCWEWFGDGMTEPPVYVHPVFERLRASEVAAARAVLKRVRFDARSNAEARRRQGARYLLNTLRNVAAIASQPEVSRLENAAGGVAAIIVAAGPSLDRSMSALREVQGKALIIAVDTALRPLLAGGIRPHAVVAVDPGEANGRHLLDLPPCEETFLVSEGSLEPSAVTAFAGRTFFFSVSEHQPWPWLGQMMASVGRLRAFGSVLTSAFDLALTMGADPIVFVGADLSYPDQRPYCRGVSFEEDWRGRERWGESLARQWQEAIDQWPLLLEPDVSGRPVRTAPHLVAFRNWLLEQMRRHPRRRFINAGGAGILAGAGVEQISPADMGRLFQGESAPPVAHAFRERFEPRKNVRLREAVTHLADRAAAGDTAVAEFRAWQAFAPLLSLEAIAQALAAAARAFSPPSPVGTSSAEPPAPTGVESDVQALQEIAAAVPFVSMTMPPQRLDAGQSGIRIFRFRTTAAATISCAIRPLHQAVAEDGVPLTRVYGLDQIRPGTYAVVRDQVHFRATDDSDPRVNGRTYTLLVPPSVAYLEALPLQDILDRDI